MRLINLYYRQNKEIKEYKDVFFETDNGFFRCYITSIDSIEFTDVNSLTKYTEIDYLKKKYGDLYLSEIRKTYDNDIYILISEKIILGIEYILSSNSNLSTQEFRIIEDLNDSNEAQLISFKEMEFLEINR